jgi:hypothetical protein
MTEGWQPIATAPKDRAVLLAWRAARQRPVVGWQQPVAVVNPGQVEWAFDGSHTLPAGWSRYHPAPTHWMPLPDMPEEYAWGQFPEAAQ